MTISSSTRRAGPFAGNGVTVAFPFTFKVFSTADLLVVQAITATGAEANLALGTNYTVALNADQNANPGGTITTLVAPPTGQTLTATSQVANLQSLDLTNAGGFYPAVINTALDRATIQIQQLAEQLTRTVKVSISSGIDPTQYLVSIANSVTAAATSAAASAASAALSVANSTNVTTVAGIAGNVTTVAGISANVTTVAGISAAVTTVAGISADVTAVKNNAANVTAVAGNATNITAVAGNNANVTAVAGNATNINAAVANATNITTVATNIAAVVSAQTNLAAIIAAPTKAAEAAASAASIAGGPVANIAGLTGIVTADAARTALSVSTRTLFSKADTKSVVFTKLTAGTAQLKAATYIDVNGTLLTFATATTIVMPTLAAGVDYAIYACTDGTVRADASFSAPSGYTTATSRKIGGFHYAPGGNATAQAGGDTTAQINEYSFWDLKFKPACPDPRGMALVADGFWADIYLMGVDHLTNGTSKYNVTIADGSSPPKIPTKFGGNGSSAYGSLNWWEAAEVLAHHGKRPPSYSEFAALAYGTTEASSGGTDPGSTILRAAYTSKWGVMLATGNLWQWGAEFGGGAAGAAWTANTGGRGSTYQMENAAIFGGAWVEASSSGSRASLWSLSPTNSLINFGSRGVCDPLILE